MNQPTLPFWKKALFSGVLLLLVLVALEVIANGYLRVARGYAGGEFLQYQFDPYKNIHPSVNWTDTRGVRHNAQGFRRSEDVELVKPTGTYRVFLMGASAAYGTGGLWPHLQRDYEVIDNAETIDAHLERLLQGRLPYDRVEVINAAIPSIWTHHHLIYLNQTILRYDPDLVLFLDGLNDHFHYDRTHDQFARYVYTEQSHVIMGPATVRSLVRMNAWWLFRKSALAHVGVRAGEGLKAIVSRRRPESEPIDVDQALEDLRYVFSRNALKMIERNVLLLQREGIPTIVMLQPMLILERKNLDRMPSIERELFEFNVAATQPNYEEYGLRATPIIAEMIEATVRPLGADFLDLTGIYPVSEGQIFTDYAHLTPEGNRILATHVASRILELHGPTSADTPE